MRFVSHASSSSSRVDSIFGPSDDHRRPARAGVRLHLKELVLENTQLNSRYVIFRLLCVIRSAYSIEVSISAPFRALLTTRWAKQELRKQVLPVRLGYEDLLTSPSPEVFLVKPPGTLVGALDFQSQPSISLTDRGTLKHCSRCHVYSASWRLIDVARNGNTGCHIAYRTFLSDSALSAAANDRSLR